MIRGKWFILELLNDDGSIIKHQAFYSNEKKLLNYMKKCKIIVLSCKETKVDTR